MPSSPIRRASPPVITLVTLVALFGMTFVLGLSASTGSRQSDLLTTSVPWLVWKVVGAIAVVVFATLAGHAILILRRGEDWGWPRQPGASAAMSAPRRSRWPQSP